MSTQREIIYAIKSIIRGGLISDDDKISDRQIAFHIDAVRATLLRQQFNKGQSLSENNIQHLACVGLESVNTSYDPDFQLDCKVFKTVKQLPKLIEGKNKDLLISIQASEFGGTAFEFIPYARLPYARNTKFKRPLAVFYNNYVYLVDAPYIEQISISGVFEQPNELSNFDDCNGQACFSWDTEYPMSSHLIDPCIKLITEELTLSLKVMQDRSNTGNQALESQAKNEETNL
jgi:hypothetical protein